MSETESRFVVSADWLQQLLGAPNLRILDASFYLPAQKRDADAEYAEGHIPGAIRFDQDRIADHSVALPHTLPSPEFFSAEAGRLGISETDTIVVYDGPGIFAAPRVWWLFRVMGAQNVFVLDGGLDGWKAEGRPLETAVPENAPATFKATFHGEKVTSFDSMMTIVEDGTRQIADARSAGRFEATEPEPRAGMRSGHMPGARNLPSSVFSSNGKFKSLPELRDIIENAGIDLSKPVVTTCGSGVTAGIISLALESLGHTDHSLYDGSWSEWGSRDDTPVVTGKARAPIKEAEPSANAIQANITYLETTTPPKLSLPIPVNIQTAIIRATDIPLHYYRYLYWRVGARWKWHKRLRMSDEELTSILRDPRCSVTVLYVNGAPAGFFELFRESPEVIELCYFGLFEEAIGHGIGKWFLLQALYSAWQDNPQKITVQTNTLDHPRALQLYQMMGFSPVSKSDGWVEPLSNDELFKALC